MILRMHRWLLVGLLSTSGCAGSSFEVAATGDGGTDTRPVDAVVDTGTSADGTSDTGTSPTDSGVVDGDAVDAGPACTKSSECATTSYCVLCGGAAKGVCKPKPAAPASFQPVCGCDGITYWNSDFAVFYNADIVANAPCTTGATKCNTLTGPSCPGGTVCVQGRETLAGCVSSEGTCWRTSRSGTPGDCATGFNPKVHICGETTCTMACQAIKEGRKFYTDATCP